MVARQVLVASVDEMARMGAAVATCVVLKGVGIDSGSLCGDRSSRGGSAYGKSCGGGLRCGLDPVLLWLWCRLTDVAPI